MKQRLLVMNGQRLVQANLEGKWETVKVEKAGAVKPGIYDIHLATPADKSKAHDGPILYADKDFVYQQSRKGFVKHDRAGFAELPEIGSNSCIKYADGKANVSVSSAKLGRKIS